MRYVPDLSLDMPTSFSWEMPLDLFLNMLIKLVCDYSHNLVFAGLSFFLYGVDRFSRDNLMDSNIYYSYTNFGWKFVTKIHTN